MRLGYRHRRNRSILHRSDRLGTSRRCRPCRHRQYRHCLGLYPFGTLVRWLDHRCQSPHCRHRRWLG